MTEEEYFRKNYPNFCHGDRLLSPYWDFFQEGVEFGERESEEKIEELEQKLEQTEKDLADYQFNYPTIKELQKENAELEAIVRNTKAVDESFALQTIRLTNAKQIIRDFIAVAIDYIDKEDKNYSYIAEAEKFLKEMEE